MLVAIVVIFAVFWFPFQLAWMVYTFSNGRVNWPVLQDISMLFVSANSVLNPVIFFIYNGEWPLGKFGACLRFNPSSLDSRDQESHYQVAEVTEV